MDDGITLEELQLAARNHGLPLESVREPITPVGLHYLLIHFDIPPVDARRGGCRSAGSSSGRSLSLDDLRARPARTLPVTLECAGNGRVLMPPRSPSQPWLTEAVGTAEWTGTPLAPLLGEAGLGEAALEVVFTGLDRGIQGGVEHDYERSLALDDALRDEVLLAYAMNGEPLPVQHGFPLRLIVPGWYGMTHVKWLRAITVVSEPFTGWQQEDAYRIHRSDDEPGVPVTRMLPRSLFAPPGIPDFFDRSRVVAAGPCALEGRAWSGLGPIVRVEVSVDGGETWADAELDDDAPIRVGGGPSSGTRRPASTSSLCRATDAAGNDSPRGRVEHRRLLQQRAAARRVPVS